MSLNYTKKGKRVRSFVKRARTCLCESCLKKSAKLGTYHLFEQVLSESDCVGCLLTEHKRTVSRELAIERQENGAYIKPSKNINLKSCCQKCRNHQMLVNKQGHSQSDCMWKRGHHTLPCLMCQLVEEEQINAGLFLKHITRYRRVSYEYVAEQLTIGGKFWRPPGWSQSFKSVDSNAVDDCPNPDVLSCSSSSSTSDEITPESTTVQNRITANSPVAIDDCPTPEVLYCSSSSSTSEETSTNVQNKTTANSPALTLVQLISQIVQNSQFQNVEKPYILKPVAFIPTNNSSLPPSIMLPLSISLTTESRLPLECLDESEIAEVAQPTEKYLGRIIFDMSGSEPLEIL